MHYKIEKEKPTHLISCVRIQTFTFIFLFGVFRFQGRCQNSNFNRTCEGEWVNTNVCPQRNWQFLKVLLICCFSCLRTRVSKFIKLYFYLSFMVIAYNSSSNDEYGRFELVTCFKIEKRSITASREVPIAPLTFFCILIFSVVILCFLDFH